MGNDLSGGGVYIRTPHPLDLGDTFPIKLYLADGGEPIEMNCKVYLTNKYGQESKDLRRGMGVKFLDLQPDVQRRVENYLKSQKTKLNSPPSLVQ